MWVLAHPQHRAAAERYLAEHPNPNLRLVWVTLPPRLDPWRPAHGEHGLRLHYLIWQHIARRAAEVIYASHDIDLSHHISWGTLSAPPLLWQLPVPFVWGPVGGGQTTPRAFLGYFGRGWPKEIARSIRVGLVARLPAVCQAARASALILATNRDTARVVARAGGRRVKLFPDAGIAPEDRPAVMPRRRSCSELTLLWAGRFEARKALPLALEALAQVRDVRVRLLVAGDGPLADEWQARALALGVRDRVRFLGRVPWREMHELFDAADAFVFTSLRDSFGAVVLEAMAHGLPVLTLDHQGVADIVPAACAIKVPVTAPAQTVAGLAAGMRTLAASAEVRAAMGEAAWLAAGRLTWSERARQVSAWYAECLTQGVR